ncbi:FOG: RRM domain [Ceraceosorus bombacis]|uniref:FOG: RRM domain n=1 Tax=Ceraceosorus bombacis TaxID=401625 RepID=A0A0P1BAK3_9BASI|nr:FOG: RRM domain [Ceraceosorus bombacis]
MDSTPPHLKPPGLEAELPAPTWAAPREDTLLPLGHEKVNARHSFGSRLDPQQPELSSASKVSSPGASGSPLGLGQQFRPPSKISHSSSSASQQSSTGPLPVRYDEVPAWNEGQRQGREVQDVNTPAERHLHRDHSHANPHMSHQVDLGGSVGGFQAPHLDRRHSGATHDWQRQYPTASHREYAQVDNQQPTHEDKVSSSDSRAWGSAHHSSTAASSFGFAGYDGAAQGPWFGPTSSMRSGELEPGSHPDGLRPHAWLQSGTVAEPAAPFPSSHSAGWTASRAERYAFPTPQSPSTITAQRAANPSFQAQTRPLSEVAAVGGETEFSIFVGDLSPHVREEDLVSSFLSPPVYPPSHPISIARAHAQQARGDYSPPLRWGPAPFRSTKSAKIMTDPSTGASRGFGFVRFVDGEDCSRALTEMQGVVITPANGRGPGRPLRVCTATPKNRNSSGAGAPLTAPSSAVDGLRSGGPPEAYANAQSAYPTAGRPVPPGPGPSQIYALGVDASFYAGHQDGMFAPPGSAARVGDEYGAAAGYGVQSSPPFSGSRSEVTVSTLPPPTMSAKFEPVLEMPSMGGTDSAMDPNNTTVFVGGLSSLISEETLKTFFVPFGEITYVKIPPGKGCGFVQFVNKGDAQRAIERMQGFPIGGGRIRLSWGRSQGDKAAAAAANAASQAAQIGQLANLSGLGSLNAQQLTQLAGLSSALSAVQNARPPAAPSASTPAASSTSDLIRHLSALSEAAAQGNNNSAGHGAISTFGAAPPPPIGTGFSSHSSLPLPSGASSYNEQNASIPGVSSSSDFLQQRPRKDFQAQGGQRSGINPAEVQHHLEALLQSLGRGASSPTTAQQSASELTDRFASFGIRAPSTAQTGVSYPVDSTERVRSQTYDTTHYSVQQPQPQPPPLPLSARPQSQPWNQPGSTPRSALPAYLRPSEAAETWSRPDMFSPFSPASSPKPRRDASSELERTP